MKACGAMKGMKCSLCDLYAASVFVLIFAPAGRRLPVIEGSRKEAWGENMMMTHGISVD